MAWRAPNGFSGMSVLGVRVVADQVGHVDLSGYDPVFAHALAAELVCHGFLATPDPIAAEPGEGPAIPLEQPSENISAALDHIDALARRDLFAYIKARGGSATIAHKDAELREIARGLPAAP